MSPPAKRLVRTLYVYTFLDDFVLLYPVYALLFTDTGLSVAETSSLFVIWSVAGLVLEVPSGALADSVSRRLLLFAGPLLAAAGFALWVIFPSYWIFALGFVLWGVRDALGSGSIEALVYEELAHTGETSRYAQVMGRAASASMAATAAAIALAIPVFAAGGYPAVGVASVLACLLTAATALAFPEHRSPVREAGDDGELSYGQVLRAGLAEARGDRRVLHGLVLLATVTAVWGALDEYVAFLGIEAGLPETAIPPVYLLVWAGATAGGLLAGRARRLRARGFGAVLAAGAVALAGGALSGHPAGFVAIAAAFGVFQLAGVVADARLQDSITGPSRATVTSVAGLGTGVITLAVYGVYGAASGLVSHGLMFALLSVPYLLVAAWVIIGRRARAAAEPEPAPAA
ncbi:MFS transporter [Nonomuraea sp. NPDC050478]|uniref:MFS transporter n=1 Tax=Nonomuraea sp. NPDC050478 TaxID=3364365 RepID=UPI0037A8853C